MTTPSVRISKKFPGLTPSMCFWQHTTKSASLATGCGPYLSFRWTEVRWLEKHVVTKFREVAMSSEVGGYNWTSSTAWQAEALYCWPERIERLCGSLKGVLTSTNIIWVCWTFVDNLSQGQIYYGSRSLLWSPSVLKDQHVSNPTWVRQRRT